MIEGILEDQREGIRVFLEDGIAEGRSPKSIALDLVGRLENGKRVGGIIGLNSQQVDAAIRAARELASGDPSQMLNYLRRQRRDARFDRIVRKAIAEGKPVAKADVERIVDRYKDRLLQARGETIARTEALNALRAGRHEGFRQLVDAGAVVDVTWLATGDGRTRDSHVALHGVKLRFGTPFVSPATGALMDFPGDASHGAPGEDVIQCRCYAEYRVIRDANG